MENTIITVLISITIPIIAILIGWLKWEKDFKLKIKRIREEVTNELIQRRMDPYIEFMTKLEAFSGITKKDDKAKNIIEDNRHIIQDHFYGEIGVICSHETRQLMLFISLGFREFLNDEISLSELNHRIWALHFSLRSDIGIIQPKWTDIISKIHLV